MALESCPARLLPDAMQEYERINKLVGKGTDRTVIDLYCVTFAKWREAEQALERDGSTYALESGVIKPNPVVLMARQYSAELLKMAKAIGLVGRHYRA